MNDLVNNPRNIRGLHVLPEIAFSAAKLQLFYLSAKFFPLFHPLSSQKKQYTFANLIFFYNFALHIASGVPIWGYVAGRRHFIERLSRLFLAS